MVRIMVFEARYHKVSNAVSTSLRSTALTIYRVHVEQCYVFTFQTREPSRGRQAVTPI